jgi:hypothetical protein
MRKNGRIQKVTMGILATMLVASLVLVVVSHVAYAAPPTQLQPLTYCWWEADERCVSSFHCHLIGRRELQVWIRQCCYVPGYGVTCTGWRFQYSTCSC